MGFLFPILKPAGEFFVGTGEGGGLYAIVAANISNRILPRIYLYLLKNPQALWLIWSLRQ